MTERHDHLALFVRLASKKHADEFHRPAQIRLDRAIDAGVLDLDGDLAAATALVETFDAADDPKASCKPNALVLFNPFLNGKGRTIAGRDGSNIAEAISPTLFLKKDAPPCVIFFGTADAMLGMGREYAAKCKELGVKAELYTAAEQPHGFFNREPWLSVTTRKADEFLTGLGYLKGESALKVPAKAPELKQEAAAGQQ